MCCRYYMEMSPELRPIIEEANRSALKARIVGKLGRPLITEGEVRHSRHRGQRKGAGKLHRSNLHHCRSSPTGQWSEPMTSGRMKASLILSRRRSETRK